MISKLDNRRLQNLSKVTKLADTGAKKWIQRLNHPCLSSVQFSPVAQLCLTLSDPMDCSMTGFFVHHQLPELTQTHDYWVGDAIQPSHPLSKNTWNNRQIWPWSTQWSRSKANRALPRECTGHRKHPLPTTQEKTLHMDITRWSITKSDWLYCLQPNMEKLYTDSKNKSGSWLWLRSWTPYCQIQTESEESRENH